MGLTRYWYQPPQLDTAAFSLWREDCRKLLEAASLPQGFREDGAPLAEGMSIRGPEGIGEPVVTPEEVAFNGDAIVAQEHEPFRVRRAVVPRPGRAPDAAGRILEYCKTAGKPYDTVVDACLIALRARFRSVSIEADAGADAKTEGQHLYDTTLGRQR